MDLKEHVTEMCSISNMDLDVEKKAEPEEAQDVATVLAAPLDQSASVELSSTGRRGDSMGNYCQELSKFIPVIVLIVGSALLCINSNVELGRKTHLHEFLISLVITSIAWMLTYMAYMCRQREAVLCKDMLAAPLWLKIALGLFGLAGFAMVGLKIAYHVDCTHYDVPVKITFAAVKAVFTGLQIFFLWLHARECVHVHQNLTRCGLMLTLATNLMLWLVAVTEESLHLTGIPNNHAAKFFRTLPLRVAVGDSQNDHSSCTIIESAFYYLYPFHIEYCLFASTMICTMWRNVGRSVHDHPSHRHCLSLRKFLLGLPGSLVVIAVGVVILVVYEIDMNDKKLEEALTLHYIGNTVILAIMIVLAFIGFILHQKEQREHVSENPTQNLELALLWISSVGELTVSLLTIVAILVSRVDEPIYSLKLAWCILTVVEVLFQTIFIVEGNRRTPAHDVQLDSTLPSQDVLCAEEGRSDGNITVYKPLSLRRKRLKIVSCFLLLFNITLWIMPAFGARPQFDNPIGADIFGFSVWAGVVNVCLAFAIFYRMHSAVSLFVVLLNS